MCESRTLDLAHENNMGEAADKKNTKSSKKSGRNVGTRRKRTKHGITSTQDQIITLQEGRDPVKIGLI